MGRAAADSGSSARLYTVENSTVGCRLPHYLQLSSSSLRERFKRWKWGGPDDLLETFTTFTTLQMCRRRDSQFGGNDSFVGEHNG